MAEQDVSNILSTPENYATPEQLKSARAYAKALLYGDMQQPVKHWSQGVSNMVSALVGGMTDYSSAQKEKAALQNQTMQQNKIIPQEYYKGQEGVMPGAPPAPVRRMGFAAEEGGAPDTGPLGRQSAALGSVESGNKYDSLGPVIKNEKSQYYGDRAYGKHQVMGKNIPEWTKEAFGTSMTPEQFLADPKAQDKLFEFKFGQLRNKYGNDADAASAWFTGRPLNKGGAGASDGYINGREYVNRFQKAMGQQPTAFSGEPASNYEASPAGNAIVKALRGGEAAPAGAPAAEGGPMALSANRQGATPPPAAAIRTPSGAQTGIDPALIKTPPGYTQQQLQDLMANPWTPPEIRQWAFQTMLQRGAPVEMKSPTGEGTYLVDPLNKRQQYFAPPPVKDTIEVGPIKVPSYSRATPEGGRQQIPVAPLPQVPVAPVPGGVSPTVGPRGDAAPAGGVPPVAGGPALAFAAPGGEVSGAPGTPAAPSAEAAPAAPEKPVQVASLDPAAGFKEAAAGAPKPEGVQVAQNAATGADPMLRGLMEGNVPPLLKNYPDAWDAYQRLQQSDVDKAVDTEARKKLAEAGVKNYETLQAQAHSARQLLPNIDMALSLMNDPNFVSGMFKEPRDAFNRVKVLFGDKYANAANESFDKLMASQVLDTMKTSLQGLGQVRLAEIDLLSRANANRYNTDASNRAVLEISRRGLQKIDKINDMAGQYMTGAAVVDPVTGKVLIPAQMDKAGQLVGRSNLDPKFDKVVADWERKNPSFSKDELKNINFIFNTGREPGKAPIDIKTGKGPDGKTMPTDAQIKILLENQNDKKIVDGFNKQFGNTAKDYLENQPPAPPVAQ